MRQIDNLGDFCPITRPPSRGARMTKGRLFGLLKSKDSSDPADRSLFKAGMRGTLFQHGVPADRTSHFAARKSQNAGTNEPKPPPAQNDQNQHRTRTNNLDKRNHRTHRTIKPTENTHQRKGQTKPPRTQNDQNQLQPTIKENETTAIAEQPSDAKDQSQPTTMTRPLQQAIASTYWGPPPRPRVRVVLDIYSEYKCL